MGVNLVVKVPRCFYLEKRQYPGRIGSDVLARATIDFTESK